MIIFGLQCCRFGYLCQERKDSNCICHHHTPLLYRSLSAFYKETLLFAFLLNDRLVQESEDGTWHVPMSVEDDLQTSRQWLCARRSKTHWTFFVIRVQTCCNNTNIDCFRNRLLFHLKKQTIIIYIINFQIFLVWLPLFPWFINLA